MSSDEIMSVLHPALTPGPFDLKRLLEYDPPLDWRPEKSGDSVIGVVHRVLQGQRRDYSFPILEMIRGDGRVVRVRCSSTVLRNAVEDVRIGNVVKITLKDSKVSRDGREYKVHEVKVLV